MREPRHRLRFALEPLRRARLRRREKLDGDRASQLGIVRAHDDAHVAAPDLAQDLETAELALERVREQVDIARAGAAAAHRKRVRRCEC
jgi:hypothetical protein